MNCIEFGTPGQNVVLMSPSYGVVSLSWT